MTFTEFTGERDLFVKFSNFLWNKGYKVKDAVHLGNNVYEFSENWSEMGMGCKNIHTIKIWKNVEGEIEFKTKVTGFSCGDW